MTAYHRAICAAAALAALGAAGMARAVEPDIKANPGIGAPDTDLKNAQGTLSDKLDRANGVVHPQSTVDPGIAKKPPLSGNTPVIKPPDVNGGPGSDVQPK
jgi:hypothetical protein